MLAKTKVVSSFCTQGESKLVSQPGPTSLGGVSRQGWGQVQEQNWELIYTDPHCVHCSPGPDSKHVVLPDLLAEGDLAPLNCISSLTSLTTPFVLSRDAIVGS